MKKYDAIYINGNIFTSCPERPAAQSMAVREGRIVWLGTDKEAAARQAAAERIVDLKGRRVLPGFVDCHMHALMLADCCRQISALPPLVSSIDDLVAEIQKVRKKQGPAQWIQGWGYDEGKLAEHRAPTRHDLDRGCSDAPVIIRRTCAHVCAVNSKALELAGIDAATPDPAGGRIGRFADGTPNGILYENARDLLNKVLPAKTDEDRAMDLLALDEILVSQGITAASDMGEFTDADYDSIFGLALQKGLRVRMTCYYMWDSVKDKKDFTIRREEMNPARPYRLAGIKLIGDGSVSGRTAWCDRPYLGGDSEYGLPVASEEDFETALAFCRRCGCQLSIHAMGARAIDRALLHTAGQKPWLSDILPPGTPPVRIEHVAMPGLDAAGIPASVRAKEAGIAFVTQPVFLYAEVESYLANLGLVRTQECYPLADWLADGVRFAFSTDAPATAWATPSDPFVCLKGAVSRKAWDGTDVGQRHRVDIQTALRLYTAEAAAMLGLDDCGQLRAGRRADFIVLDRDILAVSPDDIDKVKVSETYIGGELVYKRG